MMAGIGRGESRWAAMGDVASVGSSSRAQLDIYTQVVARLEATEEAHAALRTVFDHLPIGVVWARAIRDAGGAIADFEMRYANGLAAEVLGRPGEDVGGRRCTELHPGPEGEPWRALTTQVVSARAPFHAERYPVALRGAARDLTVGVVPYEDGYLAWYYPAPGEPALTAQP
jgi:PAS domain-containing protein